MPANPYLSKREDALTEDPLLGFNFMLELEGAIAGYFTECSGIGSENDIVEHKVVDKQGHAQPPRAPQEPWQKYQQRRARGKEPDGVFADNVDTEAAFNQHSQRGYAPRDGQNHPAPSQEHIGHTPKTDSSQLFFKFPHRPAPLTRRGLRVYFPLLN